MPDGILIIDKPSDWTSMDVCAKLRGIFHEKRIGHGGTLDPMATGVLPVFIGRATRAVEFAEKSDKEYVASLRLGQVTDTQDSTGTVLEEHPVPAAPTAAVAALLPHFTGTIDQIPPPPPPPPPPCIPPSKFTGRNSTSWRAKGGKWSAPPARLRSGNWSCWNRRPPEISGYGYAVPKAPMCAPSVMISDRLWAAALL